MMSPPIKELPHLLKNVKTKIALKLTQRKNHYSRKKFCIIKDDLLWQSRVQCTHVCPNTSGCIIFYHS